MEHSPWIEPLVRAQAGKDRFDLVGYFRRLREWDAGALPTLERLLGSHDPLVIRSAIHGIRHLKDEAKVFLPTTLVTRLVRLVQTSEDEDVRFWAVSALQNVDAPIALQALLSATSDPSRLVQKEAFDSLRGSHDPAVIRRKESALTDPDKGIRLIAIEGLGTRGDDNQVATLIRVVADDESSEVRLAAIDALERSATATAFKALCAITANDQRVEEVDRAISALGGAYRNYEQQAEGPLLAALARPEPMIRAAVARQLGTIVIIHPDRVHALLVAHLDDPEPWVRGWFALRLTDSSLCTPADLEDIIARYEDGRLPAPEMKTPVTGNLRFNTLPPERQFEFMREVELTVDQKSRLERVEQRLRSEGRLK